MVRLALLNIALMCLAVHWVNIDPDMQTYGDLYTYCLLVILLGLIIRRENHEDK